MDEIAAIVIRTDFDIGRKQVAIDFDSFFLNAFEDILRLLAAAHEDDAFDGVGVVFPFLPFVSFVLKAENAEARSVANDDATDVFYADGHTIAATDDDFADVFGGFDEAETSNVIGNFRPPWE